MTAAEIRQRFLEYFERNGHVVLPSASLVPSDDPTLLFTNAGMVQFKRVFQGEEKPAGPRAVTSQKCIRVSGKHNDLEEVGVTARHHTFFEMLGNFSFGDYFKRDAIKFAWELLTEEYGIARDRLWVTVHYSDDEAYALWQEIAALPDTRIFRLGDKDNFWQMGETGPCGPCSELHFDLRAPGFRGTDVTMEEFVERGERGEFLEIWNLVFMQFDRQADGELVPLPAPSIDTGAGLERVASALQGVASNYDTDLFTPLIERAATVVGAAYDPGPAGVSFRVLADHARAVAFLLADGVFPSNDGRGYVLRRVLRRAVRHAWLLGRREPTLVEVVDEVITQMGDAYHELRDRREHLLRATREEEVRFLSTIEAGMQRFDEIAPALPGDAHGSAAAVISGEDAFRLHDTFGFPLDLTELIARERGYTVDVAGFSAALERQRERSREDRRASGKTMDVDALAEGWEELDSGAEQKFVGYEAREVETDVIAFRRQNGRVALQLRENPFYVEAGGQISDSGVIEGEGWSVRVDEVRRIAGRAAVIGDVEGDFPAGGALRVRARVAAAVRHDTERNHTATHLLHAALRRVLGTHVVQRGSLVAPDRLRFDFSHPRPMTPDEIRIVEDEANRAIFADYPVGAEYTGYREAVARGAMALFGEKYGDVVRLISIPGVSMELCGGTHVRRTGEIGFLRIVSEGGIASGVRRIEAVTGPEAYRRTLMHEALLREATSAAKTTVENLPRRVEQLLEENRELQRKLEQARTTGAVDIVGQLIESATPFNGSRVIATEVTVASPDEMRTLGDHLRERLGSGAALLAARYPEKTGLFAIVTDDLVGRGLRADALIREAAKVAGGSGGGRPHMAQAGVGDDSRLGEALERGMQFMQEFFQT